MRVLRRIYSICASLFLLSAIILFCGYLYISVTEKYGLNEPNVAADVAKDQTTATEEHRVYVETVIINNSGLKAPAYIKQPTEQTDERNTAVAESDTLTSTETPKPQEDNLTEQAPQEPTDVSQTTSSPSQVVKIETTGKILSDEEAHEVAVELVETYANLADEFIVTLNNYRASNGLYPLALDKELSVVATHRSVENASANWFVIAIIDGVTRHIRPNGQLASSIANYYGLQGFYSENMGRFQKDVSEIVDGWQHSETHDALLRTETNTRVGFGVAKDSNGFYYWTAVFN